MAANTPKHTMDKAAITITANTESGCSSSFKTMRAMDIVRAPKTINKHAIRTSALFSLLSIFASCAYMREREEKK